VLLIRNIIGSHVIACTYREVMKKYLILYYSKTGNSKFIAEKLSEELHCDVEIIKPILNSLVFQFLISFLNIPIPVNISKNSIRQYQEIIIIGPIWGGLLIAPLRSVLKKCIRLAKQVHFAVTCETRESEKDSQYGYNKVLNKVKSLGGNQIKSITAFSTSLVSGYDEKTQIDINSKAKITEDNFSEELRARLDDFKNNVIATSTSFF